MTKLLDPTPSGCIHEKLPGSWKLKWCRDSIETFICVHMHMHAKTHTMYAKTHTHMYAKTHTHMHAKTHTHACKDTHTHVHTHMYTHTHTHTHIHTHTHTHTHTEKHALTHMHVHRLTCTHTSMQRHTHMHTHTQFHNFYGVDHSVSTNIPTLFFIYKATPPPNDLSTQYILIIDSL